MECANCNRQVPDDATVCPNCGHLLALDSGHSTASIEVITRPRSPSHPLHSSPPPARKSGLLSLLGIALFIVIGILGAIALMNMQVERQNVQLNSIQQTQLAQPSLVFEQASLVNGEGLQAGIDYVSEANSLWKLWDKTYTLALSASRDELPPYIDNLAAIQAEALAMQYDNRFKGTHRYMTDAMHYAISGFDDWLTGGSSRDQFIDRYKALRSNWQQEVNQIPR